MRAHYWSCSKFADWIRGIPKGGPKTGKDWDEWNTQSKKTHPIRYWIAEEAFDAVQNFIHYPADKLNDVRYYINNRWVSRSHSLTASTRDIKPGQWQDVGYRFLPCLFNELVNFVEVEQAWHYVMWNDEERVKYNVPWYRSGWLRWRTWRCPEAGLAYLDWASKLTNKEFIEEGEQEVLTQQAIVSKEIIALYYWWTETYRNRPDPYEVSGWTKYCETSRASNGGKLGWDNTKENEELRAMSDASHKKLREMEEAYEAEEEAMMIRLIKIRQSLWT